MDCTFLTTKKYNVIKNDKNDVIDKPTTKFIIYTKYLPNILKFVRFP